MRRAPAKKIPERRRKARTSSTPARKRSTQTQANPEACTHCSKDLRGNERTLFVEEEIGRIFCSEDCIATYFSPEVERLEKEYFKRLSPNDLSGEEREGLSHLRWSTLQYPDEVWREKTLTGDLRFTMISEFQPDEKRVWCICICLFLRGEPSFLFLAFPTRNAAMVNHYRRGERIQWKPENPDTQRRNHKKTAEDHLTVMDGLADAWTEDETLRAQLTLERSRNDIPGNEYSLYQSCLEETLEVPDEVWSLKMNDEGQFSLYHFIRHYPDESPAIWYLIVARETDDEEQIEILDAFPTRDESLVDRYRRGKQEVGVLDSRAKERVIH